MDVGAPCCKCYVPCFAHSEAKYHSHEVTVFTPWHPRCKHYFFAIAWLSENFSFYYDVEVILSENYALLQNLFQFLASSYCTCAFSHCSTFSAMHQGDTALAVLRRDAFRGIALECAEYGIKLGTQSQIFEMHECSPWSSQFIVAFIRFTRRQLLFQSICKRQDICPLANSAHKLQYMTSGPGVHWSVCAISVATGARYACDGASFLQRLHCTYIVSVP
jgi:hypothetical protein